MIVAVALVGCGETPEVKKASDEERAKAAIENIVSRLKGSVVGSRDGTIRYNATRTESIITPIVGTIDISATISEWKDSLTISLGWREGKWEFNFAKGTSVYGKLDPDPIDVKYLGQDDAEGMIWGTVSSRLREALQNQLPPIED
jgi:hypothetical protein